MLIDIPDKKLEWWKKGFIDYPDLGEYKSTIVLIPCWMRWKNDYDEMGIIESMYSKISKKDYISDDPFKKSLGSGFSLITNIKGDEAINGLEKEIISRRVKCQKDKIFEIIRDVSFRFPGAAIIEAVKQPDFLSSASSRKEKRTERWHKHLRRMHNSTQRWLSFMESHR